ncbi:MAG: dodecin family protein [Synergistaceae bacterium]|jgi:flavin-binding protein dodecin
MKGEMIMAIVKIIEVLAESSESWEAAAQAAVTEAAKTVHNIENVYIKHMQAIVEGDKITKYRVNAKISFVVKG